MLHGVARARYDCQGDISFAVNHGTEGTEAIQPSSVTAHCVFLPLSIILVLSVCLFGGKSVVLSGVFSQQ